MTACAAPSRPAISACTSGGQASSCLPVRDQQRHAGRRAARRSGPARRAARRPSRAARPRSRRGTAGAGTSRCSGRRGQPLRVAGGEQLERVVHAGHPAGREQRLQRLHPLPPVAADRGRAGVEQRQRGDRRRIGDGRRPGRPARRRSGRPGARRPPSAPTTASTVGGERVDRVRGRVVRSGRLELPALVDRDHAARPPAASGASTSGEVLLGAGVAGHQQHRGWPPSRVPVPPASSAATGPVGVGRSRRVTAGRLGRAHRPILPCGSAPAAEAVSRRRRGGRRRPRRRAGRSGTAPRRPAPCRRPTATRARRRALDHRPGGAAGRRRRAAAGPRPFRVGGRPGRRRRPQHRAGSARRPRPRLARSTPPRRRRR